MLVLTIPCGIRAIYTKKNIISSDLTFGSSRIPPRLLPSPSYVKLYVAQSLRCDALIPSRAHSRGLIPKSGKADVLDCRADGKRQCGGSHSSMPLDELLAKSSGSRWDGSIFTFNGVVNADVCGP